MPRLLPLPLRSLLACLGALGALGLPTAQAAGRSSSSEALQVSVQVVRSCAVDTGRALPSGAFDAAARDALRRSTESLLESSCAASTTRVSVLEAKVGWVESSAHFTRLDVEF